MPENDAPILSLNGKFSVFMEVNSTFIYPGYIAIDACSGMDTLISNSNMNSNILGNYSVNYTAYDNNGNYSTISRTVIVGDTTDPIVTLLGATPYLIETHHPFVDPGILFHDNYCSAGDMQLIVNGVVNTGVLGTYVVNYVVCDCNGNGTVSVNRDVFVFDSTAPMIYSLSYQEGDTISMEVNNNILDYIPEMLIVDNYYAVSELTMSPGGSYKASCCRKI